VAEPRAQGAKTGYPPRGYRCDPDCVNRELMKEYRSCMLWVLVLVFVVVMVIFANQVLGWVDQLAGWDG
jgi:predicted nucleic acid-binding Zn ribbon protein